MNNYSEVLRYLWITNTPIRVGDSIEFGVHKRRGRVRKGSREDVEKITLLPVSVSTSRQHLRIQLIFTQLPTIVPHLSSHMNKLCTLRIAVSHRTPIHPARAFLCHSARHKFKYNHHSNFTTSSASQSNNIKAIMAECPVKHANISGGGTRNNDCKLICPSLCASLASRSCFI